MISYIIRNNQNFSRYRDYQISQEQITKTISHLEKYNWTYKLVDAVDGYSITESDWKDRNIKLSGLGTIEKRPGAQGCFLSHYDLWVACSEPMVILEHDAEVTAPFPDNFDWDLGLCKLWKESNFKVKPDTVGKWSRGSWGYTLTPEQAQRLIDFTKNNGVQAVDKQLGSNVVDLYHYHVDLVIHNPATIRTTVGVKI